PALRDDLPMVARNRPGLVRRVGRVGNHGGVVLAWQVPDRALSRPGRGRLGVWRSRRVCRVACVDLLLDPDCPLRRGIDVHLCAALRTRPETRASATDRNRAAHSGVSSVIRLIGPTGFRESPMPTTTTKPP